MVTGFRDLGLGALQSLLKKGILWLARLPGYAHMSSRRGATAGFGVSVVLRIRMQPFGSWSSSLQTQRSSLWGFRVWVWAMYVEEDGILKAFFGSRCS